LSQFTIKTKKSAQSLSFRFLVHYLFSLVIRLNLQPAFKASLVSTWHANACSWMAGRWRAKSASRTQFEKDLILLLVQC